MINRLPTEIQFHLFSFFTNKTLMNFSQTEKAAYESVQVFFKAKFDFLARNKPSLLKDIRYTSKRNYFEALKIFNREKLLNYLIVKQYLIHLNNNVDMANDLEKLQNHPENAEEIFNAMLSRDELHAVNLDNLPIYRDFDYQFTKNLKEIFDEGKLYNFYCDVSEEELPTQNHAQANLEEVVKGPSSFLVAVFVACMELNYVTLIHDMIDKDKKIFHKIYKGYPLASYLLQKAIKLNHFNWVKFFLEKGAEVNLIEYEDTKVYKPLSYAISRLDHNDDKFDYQTCKNIINFLLENKADPNELSILTDGKTLSEYCENQYEDADDEKKEILDLIIQCDLEPENKKRKLR